MEWIFGSVVFLAFIYFILNYKGFRKALLYFSFFGVSVYLINYLNNEQNIQKEKLAIRFHEIKFENLTLGQIYSSWEVRGDVVNLSSKTLKGFSLKIQIQDCASSCVTIGEDTITETYLNVPPSQKRAFDSYVSFSNLPKYEKMQWSYHVTEIRGE